MYLYIDEQTKYVRKVKDHHAIHWTDTVMDTGNLVNLSKDELTHIASVLLAASVENEVSDEAA